MNGNDNDEDTQLPGVDIELQPDNVLPMESSGRVAKKRPGRPPAPGGKTKVLEAALGLSDAIMRRPTTRYAEFPHEILVGKDYDDTRLALKKEPDGEVRFIERSFLYDETLSYFKERCHFLHNVNLTKASINMAIDFAVASSPVIRISDIPPVLQKSTPGLTFRRLEFDISEGLYPTWEEFLSRTSNSEALCQWIGSLFFPKSDLQQYVWLYGEGRNGKGSIARALARIFGPHSCAWEQPPAPNREHFWTHNLLGKRLVIFSDCNDYKFVTGGFFKSLTGGDSQRIEIKAGPTFSVKLFAKFLFLSNMKPELSSQESDLRRALYCECGEVSQDFGPNYEEQLWQEIPHFLYHCVKLYQKTCIDGQPIRVDRSQIEALAMSAEDEFEALFDKHFIQTTRTTTDLPIRALPHVTANRFVHICREEKLSRVQKNMFRSWMLRKKLCEERLMKDDGKVSKVFLWITEKPLLDKCQSAGIRTT